MALETLIAPDVLAVRFGADTTPSIDDSTEWI
jgi:hypothetical protein